jgi:hypothetical protein
MRAEAHFAAGRWDAAVEAGLRAVDLAGAHGYYRLMVRLWFVLLPIACARERDDLIRQAHGPFETGGWRERTSLYARVIATAAYLVFAERGLEPAFVPDLESTLPSFELDHANPGWLAAVDSVVGTWIEAERYEGAERALDTMRARLARGPSSALARATEMIARARLPLARGEVIEGVAEAKRPLGELGRRAPWWRTQALRIVGDEASLAEARSIEKILGVNHNEFANPTGESTNETSC